MIPVWKIKPHIKGDTFTSRKITFPFDITTCGIDMQFRQVANSRVYFFWSTENDTFEKINTTQIIMKSRILDEQQGVYVSDLQITFADGTVKTYLNATLQMITDITRP